MTIHSSSSYLHLRIAMVARIIAPSNKNETARKRQANMENEKYNGWSNYETWLVAMYWVDYLGNARREEQEETGEQIQWTEEQIRDLVWESEMAMANMTDHSAGLAFTLFRNAWRVINWQEIAEHVNED